MSEEGMFDGGADEFELKIRGTFGRFETATSYPAYYFLTTIPIRKLKESLHVAADALPIERTTFSQMIQRDLNQEHVSEIRDYVRNSADRAVFFPPILVSIINSDSLGELTESYPSPPLSDDKDSLRTFTWGDKLFRLKLHGTSEPNDQLTRLDSIGEPFYYHQFGAHLELNRQRCKLVVLDGQHRYKALTSLYESQEDKAHVEGIEVPVCIVYSPFAIGDRSSLDDLRDIFITVNNEANKVSGHFIDLLKDRSLASEAVRQLAETWKQNLDGGYSMLHHLEWNSHDSKRAGQLNRDYSLTTVTVITDALRACVFAPRRASAFLQVSAIQEDLLEIDPNFDVDGIDDIVESAAVRRALSESIKKNVVGPISVLLTETRAANDILTKMADMMGNLRSRAAGGNQAAIHLEELFRKHQIPAQSKQWEDTGAGAEYKQVFTGVEYDEYVKLTRNAVFHHGLIRGWARFARDLLTIDVSPLEAAKMLVAGLNAGAFKDELGVFRSSAFTQRMLWNGDNVNFKSEWAKAAWGNLMLSVLLREKAAKAAINALVEHRFGEVAEAELQLVTQKVSAACSAAKDDYIERLGREIQAFLKRYYSEFVSDDSEADELQRLQNSSKPEDKKKFVEAISEMASARHEDASAQLNSALAI